MPNIDWKALLTAIGMLVAAIGAFYSVKVELAAQQVRIKNIEEDTSNQNKDTISIKNLVEEIRRDLAVIKNTLERK